MFVCALMQFIIIRTAIYFTHHKYIINFSAFLLKNVERGQKNALHEATDHGIKSLKPQIFRWSGLHKETGMTTYNA